MNSLTPRLIFLDTETTGLSPTQGDRVIEIACVEMINRVTTGNTFHHYLNPQGKLIDAGAQAVHGISADFLVDKPTFSEIANDFINFIQGAELVIHNAPFDIGFLNAELSNIGWQPLKTVANCTVTDTLMLAKNQYPGKRNSLDGLCDRFAVNRTNRSLHGALLDARLLAEVYLHLTRSQNTLGMILQAASLPDLPLNLNHCMQLMPFIPSVNDKLAHEAYLDGLETEKKITSIWRKIPNNSINTTV
jgi:DNA polymerase-3 subunit epsilon